MAKRFEDPEVEHRLMAIAAARMRSEGLTQAKIAKRLGKSQPEVSRLVTYAQSHKFLARSPSFLSQNVEEADLREVDRRWFVHEKLRKALLGAAPAGHYLDVRVLPDKEEAFAAAAATCVAQLLRRARLIGIMWGRSVERLVSQLQGALDLPPRRKPPRVQCIPLCGDPVHLMNQRYVGYSASSLAGLLGKALQGQAAQRTRRSDLPCLVGVPAYLPRSLLQQIGTAAWQGFIQGIPGYRAIFGPANGNGRPLVERVDTIISGTGIIVSGSDEVDHHSAPARRVQREKTGDFIRERLELEDGVTKQALAELIFGDIGGWLLRRQRLSPADQLEVDSLNQGWTGITGEHLKRVARAAKAGGAPGIILLAAGRAKAEMVAEIVRQGLVNQLLLDSSLTNALKTLFRW